MGIFYNPPQPPTASTAGTLPEPHVPLATPGSEPPRYSTALMMVAVMASWPASLEPRLTKPNDQQQKIAPLTLPTGQQPPTYSIRPMMGAVSAAWPPDLEPRLGAPNNQRVSIAPLTLTYGSQPPPTPPLAVEERIAIDAWSVTWGAQRAPISTAWVPPPATLVVGTGPIARASQLAASWPDSLEPRLQAPNNQRVTVAPLTLVYGDQPPILGVTTAARASLVGSTWPADLEPRLGLPNNRQVALAPLSLTYGDAPPRVGTVPIARASASATAWFSDPNVPPRRSVIVMSGVTPPPVVGQSPAAARYRWGFHDSSVYR